MAKYRVRLESPDAMRDNGEPHFRLTTLSAANEDAARRVCVRMEAGMVSHQLSDETLKGLEKTESKALDKGDTIPGDVRAQLAAHRQDQPYDVVDVEEVK